MDYEEFLWAIGDQTSYKLIRQFYETGKPLGQQANRKLLSDTLPANLGYLYENVIAQILAANGNELFYYTFMNESSRHTLCLPVYMTPFL